MRWTRFRFVLAIAKKGRKKPYNLSKGMGNVANMKVLCELKIESDTVTGEMNLAR